VARIDIIQNKLEVKTDYCKDQSPVVSKNLHFKGFVALAVLGHKIGGGHTAPGQANVHRRD